MTLEPRKMKFIDRIVADSRDIGLNHTAGLSLPQQVMMTMFSLYELMDAKKDYQKACMEIVNRRAKAMIEGMGLQLAPNPNFDAYYGLIDFEFWARKNIGDDAVEYLKKNIHPARSRVPPGRGARNRAAERRRVRGARTGRCACRWRTCLTRPTRTSDAAFARIARGYRDAYEASKDCAEEVPSRTAAAPVH